MKANDVQVGGDHYKSAYQHWDWAEDVALPRLLYAATKYWTRWKEKGGLQDLEKSQHFLHKFLEVEQARQVRALGATKKFLADNNIDVLESEAIWHVLQYSLGDAEQLAKAAHVLTSLVTAEREKADAATGGAT